MIDKNLIESIIVLETFIVPVISEKNMRTSIDLTSQQPIVTELFADFRKLVVKEESIID